MKLTFTRSLLVLVALGVPLAAGGMYALSRKESPEKAAGKRKPLPCACCDAPSSQQFALALAEGDAGKKTDCPMFGGTPQRNLVNLVDKNIPTNWNVEEGSEKNLKWAAQLGDRSYGGPIIADGRIYVGTNNAVPRDPKIKGQQAVLMAFNEADGKFLWQIAHKTPPLEIFKLGATEGLCSSPIVEGDGIFYVTPGAEVVRANTEGKIVWAYDMMKELKVVPFHLANCSPLIVGDLLMLITSNGVDDQGALPSPKAPSFIALNKNTGKLAWQSSLPGDKILEGQWTNPCVAVVNGKTQVIFPGGDAVLYSLEPETGKLLWKCDCQPVRKEETIPYFVATPAVDGDRLYIGLGVGPELGKSPKYSHMLCIDVTKTGDVSPKSLDAKDPRNASSALVWAFGGMIEPRPAKGRREYFGNTISTAAVHDGLVYAAEEAGFIHCLDAKTGQRYWSDDLKAGVWGSPYYVDGKVYIGSEDRSVAIYAHGKTMKRINIVDMGEVIHSTPLVANGVLYVATKNKLYAIAEKK